MENTRISESATQLSNVKKQKSPERGRLRRKKVLRHSLIIIVVLSVLASGGIYLYSQLKAEYTINYVSYTTQTGSISNSLSFSGTLQAIDNTTYTASSATTIRSVLVSEGDDVKTGDTLLKLANGRSITADFDGRVNQLYVSEGDAVANGTSLVQLVDFSRMKVSIRVDEYDILDVSKGDACRITTTATQKTFASSISGINYVSSSTGSVAYYTATAYVDVSEGTYPGMQVTVTVPKEEVTDAVILKEEALSFDAANRAFVYTANDAGNMDMTYVSTGVSNGNYVEITDGLCSGDVVYAINTDEAESSGNSLLAGLFGGMNISGERSGSASGRMSNFSNVNGFSSPGGSTGGTASGNRGNAGGGIGGGAR